MATTTNKSASTVTTPSPQAPQITTTTSEKTGIHYSTLYLHTVPGTIKCVCLVRSLFPIFRISTTNWFLTFISFFSRFSWLSDSFAYNAVSTVQWASLSSSAPLQWSRSGSRGFCWCCICSMSSMCSTKFHGWKLNFSSVCRLHFSSCWRHR